MKYLEQIDASDQNEIPFIIKLVEDFDNCIAGEVAFNEAKIERIEHTHETKETDVHDDDVSEDDQVQTGKNSAIDPKHH